MAPGIDRPYVRIVAALLRDRSARRDVVCRGDLSGGGGGRRTRARGCRIAPGGGLQLFNTLHARRPETEPTMTIVSSHLCCRAILDRTQ